MHGRAQSPGHGHGVVLGAGVQQHHFIHKARHGSPALRQTLFITGEENSVAVRGASRFLWQLSDTSAFTNDTFLFWDDAGSVQNTTALTSKLFGALSARLSFNLAWEEQPPIGLEKLDTTSRITLVYNF